MTTFIVIAPLADRVLDATKAWGGIAGQLTAMVMTPILIGVTIMVMWHGVSILRGAGGGHHILDVFAKLLRAFLVVSLALAGGAYSSTVVGFFMELRNGLTGLFVPGAHTSYDALDLTVNTIISTWDPVWLWAQKHINLSDISGLVGVVCWALMAAALVIFAAICAINLIIIDFSLALIFALGPIFVACFAFQATARFTDAWLGAVLKYVFTAVVISALIGLGIGILNEYSSALGGMTKPLQFVSASLAAIAASLILSVLANRIPSIAADMVGGIGIAVFGTSLAKGPVSAARDLVKGVAGGAANVAAFGVGRAVGAPSGGGSSGAGTGTITGGGSSGASGSLGQKMVDMATKTHSVLTGSTGNAFRAGRGGSSRPPGKTHEPGT